MPETRPDQENEITQLRNLILRSGFPLQIEITASLFKHFGKMDPSISTSSYYLDKDEKKGRELDIDFIVMIEPRKEGNPIIFLQQLIECKNVPGNAWVFFKSPYKIHSHVNSTSVLDALGWLPRQHVEFAFLNELHFRRIPKTTVYGEFVLDKKTSNNRKDNLFNAIISVVKATSYQYETCKEDFKDLIQTEDLLDLDYINIFYTAVVFNGKMYVADEVEKGRHMQLTPVNHVISCIDYVSGNYNIGAVIDVVHKEVFEDFAKMISNDVKLLRAASDGNTGKKFREELSKAIEWHRSRDSRISVA